VLTPVFCGAHPLKITIQINRSPVGIQHFFNMVGSPVQWPLPGFAKMLKVGEKPTS